MIHCSSNRVLFSIGTFVLVGLILVTIPAGTARAQDSPVIDVWYGLTQSFGHIGNPQPWANILGNVSDSNGISSLVYSLNGGPDISLSVGPDGRRLVSSGDFNIDLATADLLDGSNEVIVTAVDGDTPSNQTVVTVTVDYDATSGNVWPLPYSVDWATTTKIEDVGQVVDGLWSITPSGAVRTTIPGYDRLIAMGDMSWDDYEVTVPITLHTIPSSIGAGILFRWNGHTDYPVSGWQPKTGYLPLGMICWYRAGRLELWGNDDHILGTVSRTLSLDVAYIFKARVETIPGVGGLYSFKVWEEGQPEPTGWDITGQEQMSDPQGGSMTLISHLADVSFGDVTISPVPLTISNIAVTLGAGETEATVTWTTDEPASSSVAYGLTAGYELGAVSDMTLVTDHSIILTGLVPETLYHYQITSIDGLGNPATTADRTFSTITAGIVSDDFSAPTLNTDVWTFIDPQSDGSYTFTGTNTEDAWVNISVPAGTEHEVWDEGITVPHLLQSVNNADFEIEVKFESSVNQQHQEQGILIKEDSGNYMRFEFFSISTETRIYTATFESMVPNTRLNAAIDNTGVAPLYMRVNRQGDQWTQTYSHDGTTWLNGVTFTHGITVTGIGIYAGNASGSSSPAHTASFDYFFDTASPVEPEDPSLPWNISAIEATPGETTAIVTWTTDVPTTSSVAHGLTPGYELGSVSDPAYVTEHSITLTDLDPSTLYHYQVTSEDPSFNSISTPDMTFTTTGPDISGIVSDDFNSETLNTSVWTLVDPLEDCVFTMTGYATEDAWANLAIPAGVEHQVYSGGIQAPHLLQSANDTDFEVEVKFETPVINQFQEQGVVIKQDDNNYMRFEFYSTSSSTMLYAAGYTPSSSTYVNTSIGTNGIAPLYMRIKREGDQWTQSYSFDGENWTSQPSFTHILTVTGLGPYSGNAVGAGSPAHTTSIDYFFNTASPIIPEDDREPIVSVVPAYGTTTCTDPITYTFWFDQAGVGDEVRGIDVTFQVDGAVVTVSDYMADIVEGSYLPGFGGTTFFALDKGSEEYTVTTSILGGTTGATGSGDLFTVEFTPEAEGISAITITDVKVRDVNNAPLGSAMVGGEVRIDCTGPTMEPIVEAEGVCYNEAPTFANFGFDDDYALDWAEYQIDADGEVTIFTGLNLPEWNDDGWALPGFAGLSEGTHTVYFYVADMAGNENGVAYSWSFIKDTEHPVPPTDFLAMPGHNKVHLTWTDPTGDASFVGVEIRLVAWADYPQYGTPPSYPDDHLDGMYVTQTSGGSFDDDPRAPRDIYYYAAFSYDCAGNYSVFDAGAADRSTSYWLGDIDSTGYVNGSDLVPFSNTFGVVEGGGGWNPFCDFGPTDDWSRFGIPLPDDAVDFEDLMIFSMNYGKVDPAGFDFVPEERSLENLENMVAFELVPTTTDVGTIVSIVMNSRASTLKGARLLIETGDGCEIVTVTKGDAIAKRGDIFFGTIPSFSGMEICVAALGVDKPIAGSGEIAKILVKSGGSINVSLAEADIRDTENRQFVLEGTGSYDGPAIPIADALNQNFPNPFNPATTVAFDLAKPATVRIGIYDVSGRLVRTLIDRSMEAGSHEIGWNGTNNIGTSVPSGLYFYRMTTSDGFTATRKMILLR